MLRDGSHYALAPFAVPSASMGRWRTWLSFLLAALVAGCAAPEAPRSSSVSRAASAPKRITAAIGGDPTTLYNKFSTSVPGSETLEQLVNSGLSAMDHANEVRPLLAEAVPSLENGQWQLFPDGSMETVWHIRDGARWHDGTPLSVDDLSFTVQVSRDPDLPIFASAPLSSIRDIQPVDARTVRVGWSRPFINADRLFGSIALPIPKHLLEMPYSTSKASFTELPYWSLGFVGNGPFRLKEWQLGSHIVFEAFDQFALGRPKIDEIEVRFVLDSSVLLSSALAGAIDLTLGRNFAPEQAKIAREQWRDGRVDVGRLESALNLWPQFVNPSPAVMADIRFRRALIRAIDRNALAETFEAGLVSVAHSWLVPTLPEYEEMQRYVVRYDYDPRGAVQEIQELGYSRGADGSFRDRSGQRLDLEIRSTPSDIVEATVLAVADYWGRAGMAIEPVVIPRQRATDAAYRAAFPAFELQRFPSDAFSGMSGFHSRASRLPENNFIGLGGSNQPRYSNPGFDELIDRFAVTIPRRARLEITGQIVRHMTEQLTVLPLFYDPATGLVGNRLLNVPALGQNRPWNAHEWDIRS